MRKNVIVIGAGASGLMAAAAAAQSGHKVTVLEKNEKAGKKIYITGKGRCNLTNDCDTQDFFAHVARNHRFLYSAVYGFDHDMVKDFFVKNGCPVKVVLILIWAEWAVLIFRKVKVRQDVEQDKKKAKITILQRL